MMTFQQLREVYSKLKSVPAGTQSKVPMKQAQKPIVAKASAPAKKVYQSGAAKATQPKRKGCCGR